MRCYLIILVTSTIFLHTFANLQELNVAQDYLNPLNDPDNDNVSTKDQDKRTIFNPTIPNYAWAKHVAVRPWGTKQVIGFGPVDLKYTPVLRPISFRPHAYHYDRPKIHFHLKKPLPVFQTGWKPILPAIKPVGVIAKPVHPVHVDHVHTVPHVDHVHAVPHVDHVHVHKEPHVHIHPVPVQPAPIHLPHLDHVHTVTHIDQVHAIPQPVPVQHVPVIPRPLVPRPIVPAVPAANVFEVTRPDLGVLPIGTVFSSPVLKEIPAPQLAPHPVALPPVPHVHPVPQVTHLHPVHQHLHTSPQVSHFHQIPTTHLHSVHPHLHQVEPHLHHLQPHLHPIDPHLHSIQPHLLPVQPHLHPIEPHPHPVEPHLHPAEPHFHHTVVPQPILPPGTSVEYHGSTNFLNLFKSPVPAPLVPQVGLPQPHLHQVQPPAVLPNQFHLHYPQIPQSFHPQEPHDAQVPITQPGFNSPFPSQQHPPINDQVNFQLNDQAFSQPQDFPNPDQPRFQPAEQVSSQHYFQGPEAAGQLAQQGYVYPRPEKSIQPGQTDLQFPVHLPQHPGFHQTQRAGEEEFEESRFSEERGRDARFTETVFKPSIQLEPPYKK